MRRSSVMERKMEPFVLKNGRPTGANLPLSFGLREWIEKAGALFSSREAYLLCAVNIASLLTNYICQNVGAPEHNSTETSPPNLLQNFVADNVVIFCEPPAPLLSQLQYLSCHTIAKIRGVAFQRMTEENCTNASLSSQSCDAAISISSRQACAELGEIFLELFSLGRHRSSCFPKVDNSSQLQNSTASIFPPSAKQNSRNPTLSPGNKQSALYPNDVNQKRREISDISGESSTKSLEAVELLLHLSLPLSICGLVSDLLNSNYSNISKSAYTSLEEVQFDLKRMKDQPNLFLFDRSCPEKAMKDLFQNEKLFGRNEEMQILENTANRVSSMHENSSSSVTLGNRDENMSNRTPQREDKRTSEAIFLSGNCGSGKSSLIRHLKQKCEIENWFVLSCKFDHQLEPFDVVSKSIDDFFRRMTLKNECNTQVHPLFPSSFKRIAWSIVMSIDNEGLSLLIEHIPSLSNVLALLGVDNCIQRNGKETNHPSLYESRTKKVCEPEPLPESVNSTENVVSGGHQLHYLFHLLFKSLCSSSMPLLIVMDDLQWADDLTLDIIGNFGETGDVHSTQERFLLVGSYQDNEVNYDSHLMEEIKHMDEADNNINVTMLSIRHLSISHVNEMISFGLCLPMRVTRGLAEITSRKTMGNPMFVLEFLKSLVASKLLYFSMKWRRWMWDEALINEETISSGVARLIVDRLCELSDHMIKVLKIVSCFGSQVEESTMKHLSPHFLPLDLMNCLNSTINEGMIKRTGRTIAFPHDMVQQAVYDLMPTNERMWLHKKIGLALMQATAHDDENRIRFLAADQINICKSSIALSPRERVMCVELNLDTGKRAISMSSFEQAHSFIEAGLSLIEDDYWETHYSLSLELHKLSVVLSFVGGKTDIMTTRLREILSNVNTPQDNLIGDALLVKFLAFCGRYVEAIDKCFESLSKLDEIFPNEVHRSKIWGEMADVQNLLTGVTKEKILQLPRMTNGKKLNAMKFLTLLYRYSFVCRHTLVPLVASRMVKLTFEYGLCEDSIIGLVVIGQGLIDYAEDFQLAYDISIIAESLIKENPNEHSLRALLCVTLYGYTKAFLEPFQTIQEKCLDCYESGMKAGDMESAMFCYFCFFRSSYYSGKGLLDLNNNFPSYLQEVAKHQQYRSFYLTLSISNACAALSGITAVGNLIDDIGIKTYDELHEIAEQTSDIFLKYQSLIDELSIKFWMRDFIAVVTLAEKIHKHEIRGILDAFLVFYEGIAALCLARDTKQVHWKNIGKSSIEAMALFAKHFSWNFENKLFLLRAELHFAQGDHDFAKLLYESSISSAHKHHFLNEEALAHELFGIFWMEKSMVDKALEQLRIAQKKYMEWGATKKADAVNFLIDNADPSKWQEAKWQER